MSIMRVVLGMCLLLVAVTAKHNNKCDTEFAKFVSRFHRRYASPEARSKAKAIFCGKLADVERRNALGLAKFTAFVESGDQEWDIKMSSGMLPPQRRGAKELPASLHTRLWNPEHDAPTAQPVPVQKIYRAGPIWDQGQCGSSWAMPVVDNIMIQQYGRTGKMVPLSAQELVACDTVDDGCNGGDFTTALSFIVANLSGALATNASIPYTAGIDNGVVTNCTTNGTIGAFVQGQVIVNATEAEFTRFVGLHAPLAVSVDGSQFCEYAGGIISGGQCNTTFPPSNGLLIVGYDDAHKPPYWILKNSFTADWGEDGFVRLEKGINCLSIALYNGSSAILGSHILPPPPPAGPTSTIQRK